MTLAALHPAAGQSAVTVPLSAAAAFELFVTQINCTRFNRSGRLSGTSTTLRGSVAIVSRTNGETMTTPAHAEGRWAGGLVVLN